MRQRFNLPLILSSWLIFVSLSASSDVKVSNLDDINFGLYSGAGNLRFNESICINTLPISNYQVTIWGSGLSGEFVVSNGLEAIPFSVKYRNRTGNGNGGIVWEWDDLLCDIRVHSSCNVHEVEMALHASRHSS